MMRRSSLLWCTPLALGLALGCGGDDDVTGSADAEPEPDEPDAEVVDTPDAMVDPGVNFLSPEGGEVRVEYVNMTPAAGLGGRDTGTRLTAFFYTDGGAQGEAPLIGACQDITDRDRWPFLQMADREPLDVGGVIVTGGPNPMTFTRATGLTDPVGRNHDVDGDTVADPWWFSFGINDTDQFITDDANYDVVLTGSDEWPAQVYENALTIPKAMTAGAPGDESFTLTAGEDLEVAWSVEDSANVPEGEVVNGVAAFNINGYGAVVLCIQDPDTGGFTVDADLVDLLIQYDTDTAAAAGGAMARQTLVHHIGELTNGDDVTGRRVDFIGVWCNVTPFSSPAL